MKERLFWIFLLVFGLTFAFFGNSQKSLTAEEEQWEYKVVSTGSDSFPGGIDLEKLGNEGWELITYRESKPFTQFVFKRRK